ncbi:MAG: hypothetical protein J0H41_14830 [Rhizobiales bacterium]|nr:hypothetical protein [Hyphomicrobiales bacterium]
MAQKPKKAVAPPALQAEFDGFIAKFRAALKANDSAAVSGMTRFPFEHDSSYPDSAQFRAKAYPAIFTPKTRDCIQRGKAVYDRDGDSHDNYFIFCGKNIFTFTKMSSSFLFVEIGAND